MVRSYSKLFVARFHVFLLLGVLTAAAEIKAQMIECNAVDNTTVLTNPNCKSQVTLAKDRQEIPSNAIQPLVTTTIEHYEIRGDTFAELMAEINAKGHGGSGTTSGLVTYRFTSQKSEGVCRISQVRASCKAKLRLPHWENQSRGSQQMQEQWLKAYTKLRNHELGHAQICIDVAKDVERALWSTRQGSACYYVDQDARARADAVIFGMNARQADYDLKTDHGRR